MRRMQMCKKVNRNNSFNHLNRKASHINAVNPEILVGQIWLQEDEPPAVEIIELNTSNEFETTTETANKSLDHPWSYANDDRMQQIEDNYKINKKARERRRAQNRENHFLTTNTSTNTNNHFINNNNHYYTDMMDNHIEDKKLLNHQVNCFTVFNKHFINSDTSSDGDFADVEIITSNDIMLERNNWDARNNPYEEEIITYDPDDLDKETRTIWIYSFKNKHLLTEEDFELANIPPKEMSSGSTSCSMESDEERRKDKSSNVGRIGSPVPPAYIPKLNLSLAPTLSTVTEVSEPNKQTPSNGSYKSPKHRFQKPRNSWVLNESEKIDSGRSVRKHEKSTNIVNWMALSPRERRRRSKEPGDKWEGSLLKLETLPTEELVDVKPMSGETHNKPENNNTLRLQVDVDVHVSLNDRTPEKRSLGTPNSATAIIQSNMDDYIIDKINTTAIDIKGAQDRGDHDIENGRTQKNICGTQCVKPSETVPVTADITKPTKKVESALWEREEKEEKETSSYDYVTNKLDRATEARNVADDIWMRNNMPLLRPSKWDEYIPIAETPLSFHLSIATIVEERPSWFKRFLKYINCCK